MYYNRKICVKLLHKCFLSGCMNANASTKAKTHYDTLEILPSATYSEIKTAYYKLSLQYHPDKNKTETAKKIFQDISNAYEVLSNHKTRKQYDRNICIMHGSVGNRTPKRTEKADITYSPSANIYNFDEWNRMHYQRSFQSYLARKRVFAEYQEMKENSKKKDHTVLTITTSILTSITFTLLFATSFFDNDKPVNKSNEQSR